MNFTVLYANFQNFLCFQPHSAFSLEVPVAFTPWHSRLVVGDIAGLSPSPTTGVWHPAPPAVLNQSPPVHMLASCQHRVDLPIWYGVLSCSLCPYWCVFPKFLHYDFLWDLRTHLPCLTQSPMLYSCLAVTLESQCVQCGLKPHLILN